MTFRSAACLLGLLCLLGCDQKQDTDSKSVDEDETSVIATAQNELADQSYEDVRGTADCTDDCSGHNAGWDWARKNDVQDADNWSGNSDSFIDGCKAYTEELQRKIGEIEEQNNQN